VLTCLALLAELLAEVRRLLVRPLRGVGQAAGQRRPVAQLREEGQEGEQHDRCGHDHRDQRDDREVPFVLQRADPGEEREQERQGGQPDGDPAAREAHLEVGERRQQRPRGGEQEQHEGEADQVAPGEPAEAEPDAEELVVVGVPRERREDQVDDGAAGDDVVRHLEPLEVHREAAAGRLAVGVGRAVAGRLPVPGLLPVGLLLGLAVGLLTRGRLTVGRLLAVPRLLAAGRLLAVPGRAAGRRLTAGGRATEGRLWRLAGGHRGLPRRFGYAQRIVVALLPGGNHGTPQARRP
jgi:hypothetical protein